MANSPQATARSFSASTAGPTIPNTPTPSIQGISFWRRRRWRGTTMPPQVVILSKQQARPDFRGSNKTDPILGSPTPFFNAASATRSSNISIALGSYGLRERPRSMRGPLQFEKDEGLISDAGAGISSNCVYIQPNIG